MEGCRLYKLSHIVRKGGWTPGWDLKKEKGKGGWSKDGWREGGGCPGWRKEGGIWGEGLLGEGEGRGGERNKEGGGLKRRDGVLEKKGGVWRKPCHDGVLEKTGLAYWTCWGLEKDVHPHPHTHRQVWQVRTMIDALCVGNGAE